MRLLNAHVDTLAEPVTDLESLGSLNDTVDPLVRFADSD
jgi:hypothetical protein